MDGQLKDHPLVELIHEISEARLSGALHLAREQVKAAVYFDAGQTVAASANLRAMRLVELLRRAGAVESARIDAVVREGMSDEHAGLALVRAGLLDAAGLKRLQWRQSSEVLRELLLWAEGDWSFDPRVRLAGGYREPLDTEQLLVEGARALPHEMVARRLADEDETVARAPPPRGGGPARSGRRGREGRARRRRAGEGRRRRHPAAARGGVRPLARLRADAPGRTARRQRPRGRGDAPRRLRARARRPRRTHSLAARAPRRGSAQGADAP